jgi:hypothetical protein
MTNGQGKKYLKDKDGKFNGSLPESPNFVIHVELPRLPAAPSEFEVSGNAEPTAAADLPVIEDASSAASAVSDAISSEAEAQAEIFEAGVREGIELERARIVAMFEEQVAKLDAIRPESYKKVADMADLRIRTMRVMIKKVQELE